MDRKIDDQINAALSREPEFQLKPDFADRIISMIETANQKERKQEIFWMSFAGLLFIIALVVVLVVTNFRPTLTGLSFLSNYVGLIGFGIVFILFLNFLDKKLVRKTQADF